MRDRGRETERDTQTDRDRERVKACVDKEFQKEIQTDCGETKSGKQRENA